MNSWNTTTLSHFSSMSHFHNPYKPLYPRSTQTAVPLQGVQKCDITLKWVKMETVHSDELIKMLTNQ